MKKYPFDRTLSNETELLDYFIEAIQYRIAHKDRSVEIAVHVFDKTHPSHVSFSWGKALDDLRFEFIALEAPGMPKNDDKDPDEYDDELWQRLLILVNDAKKKQTV
jgi:hypothetical protein